VLLNKVKAVTGVFRMLKSKDKTSSGCVLGSICRSKEVIKELFLLVVSIAADLSELVPCLALSAANRFIRLKLHSYWIQFMKKNVVGLPIRTFGSKFAELESPEAVFEVCFAERW